ncbi:MAG: hypothetical protein MUF01_02360 [Bryobacterales bacterium]|jgi:hypothetical protein|nr:hypothetical protein [Bryobacterales bacterium]
MPNAFFTHVMRACSQFEQAVLALVLFRTAGDAQRGRPTWVRLSEEQLAKHLDGHPNGISRAIGNLEEMGAIESRRVGRAKEYRAVVEAWDKLAPRTPRKIEPKRSVAALAEDLPVAALRENAPAEVAPAADPTVFVILPGEKSKRALREVCPAGDGCCLVQAHAANKPGTIPTLECGDRSPSILPVANKQGMIPTLECGDRSPDVRPVDDGDGVPVLLNGDFQEFYALIDGLLSAKLAQQPPMAILETQFARMKAADVPLDYLETRLRLRLPKFRSYGLLEHVVSDCIAAVQQARASGEQARQRRAEGRGGAVDAVEIRKQLRAQAVQLPADPAYSEVQGLLHQAADDAERHAEDIVHLDMHLENVETALANVAEETLTAKQRADVESAVEREVRPHRDRMAAPQFAALRAQVFRAQLFAHLGLPRIRLLWA